MTVDREKLRRWRLILGASTNDQLSAFGGVSLSEGGTEMDDALESLYPCVDGEGSEMDKGAWDKKHIGSKGWGKSDAGRTIPKVANWLGQIRTFFPSDVVVLLQHDAIERRRMKELLFEPEVMASVEPSLDLAAAVLEMKSMVPEAAKAQARELVRAAVEEVRKVLESQFVQAIRGALNRSNHSPFRSLPNLDFPRTIRRNLKNYNSGLQTIIPEQIAFFSRQRRQSEWNIIIAMDQSGSMHNSLIYGGIMGAILASVPAVETHMVAFNHSEVVDLTKHCSDPVDLLFGIQLGGTGRTTGWRPATASASCTRRPGRSTS